MELSGEGAPDPRRDHTERSARTAVLVDQLHAIVLELERLHPGRRFPLDGHLVGSLGEAAAEAMFQLELLPASTAGHDARAVDGRTVEIKATYGSAGVGVRQTSRSAATALVVLRLSKDPSTPHEVVYNGPLAPVLDAAGPVQSNGQSPVSLTRLRQLDRSVSPADRVPRR